ncbi:MAG: Mrp/NBP35 family ATP-binding protein [Gammaproteobacteria bacterium]|nr:Mrp/NBP35 family ATP-binding protein [Gammaproteobacteria bacterium]
MPTPDRETLQQTLNAAAEPWLGGTFGEADWPLAWDIDAQRIKLTVSPGYPLRRSRSAFVGTIKAVLEPVAGGVKVEIAVEPEIKAHPVQPNMVRLASIKNVLAVASAKGGVGKSTVAVNLALALADEGARVGMLDADIYGPSQPRMLGLSGRPDVSDKKKIQPLCAFGLKVMSAGFLVDPATPMVWRGPMVTQALTQLLGDTDWGELDYLVVDMPPGTGDIQLTLAQRVPVAGSVIVTTPQEIAVADARKGVAMFRKVEVPVLGIVENMAGFRCAHCNEVTEIFGAGGGARLAEESEVPLLGTIPLAPDIQSATDSGRPSVASDPEGSAAADYRAAALKAAAVLAQRSRETKAGPKIVME